MGSLMIAAALAPKNRVADSRACSAAATSPAGRVAKTSVEQAEADSAGAEAHTEI
nr:hypothetical protein [Mycobacterium tuberculosis]